MDIKAVVNEFAGRLQALIEVEAMERARAAVLDAFGVPEARKPGRPRKRELASPVARSIRRKLPRQLCPVPGCTNTAAPVFGMVCAKHKDVPKAKLRKYREARRAKKLGTPIGKAPRRQRRRSTKASPTKTSPTKASPTKASPTSAAQTVDAAAAQA